MIEHLIRILFQTIITNMRVSGASFMIPVVAAHIVSNRLVVLSYRINFTHTSHNHILYHLNRNSLNRQISMSSSSLVDSQCH